MLRERLLTLGIGTLASQIAFAHDIGVELKNQKESIFTTLEKTETQKRCEDIMLHEKGNALISYHLKTNQCVINELTKSGWDCTTHVSFEGVGEHMDVAYEHGCVKETYDYSTEHKSTTTSTVEYESDQTEKQ